jgi:hypothetical protein
MFCQNLLEISILSKELFLLSFLVKIFLILKLFFKEATIESQQSAELPHEITKMLGSLKVITLLKL